MCKNAGNMKKLENQKDYKLFSKYYDKLYTPSKDLRIWRRYAKLTGSPILELSCGTGRVLIDLAKRGYDITGLDNSREMLKIAEQKIKKMNLAKKTKLVYGDMFDFDINKKFKLIIIPLTSFFYGKNSKQKLACLKKINQHLQIGGLCIMDNYKYISSSPYKFISSIKNKEAEIFSKIDIVKKHGESFKAIETFKHIFKKENKIIHRKVVLYPLSKEKMEKLIAKSGLEIKKIVQSCGGEKNKERDASKDRNVWVLRKIK